MIPIVPQQLNDTTISIGVGRTNIEIGGSGTSGKKLRLQTGGKARFRGEGFQPGSRVRVRVFSDPMDMGEVTIDADGSFDAEFDLPPGLPDGEHTVQFEGTDPDGRPLVLAAGVLVADSDAAFDEAGLPVTGSDISSSLGLGALLVGIGGVAVVASRRRRAE